MKTFFVIEILPTAVKLKTPIGQYDWAIYRKEKDFVEIYLPNKSKELEIDLESTDKLRKENEAYKNLKEQELYKKTVDEIARIQNDLALKIMQEYEARERNNIEQNIDKFLNDNRNSRGS
jgi:predicted transport protein